MHTLVGLWNQPYSVEQAYQQNDRHLAAKSFGNGEVLPPRAPLETALVPGVGNFISAR
jgi:hypothetical protein